MNNVVQSYIRIATSTDIVMFVVCSIIYICLDFCVTWFTEHVIGYLYSENSYI